MNHNDGFTLTEVLVSVALLGLVIVLINSFISFIGRSVNSKRSSIILEADHFFREYIDGEITLLEIEPKIRAIEYQIQSDTTEWLISYSMSIIEKSTGRELHQFNTSRVAK